MKWSFGLGRWLGIEVRVHLTFLLLLGFVALQNGAEGGVAAAVDGVLSLLGLFACVVMHEYGHALTARRYGIATRDITLLPIGGLARLERMPDRPAQELWVALAGPAVNVVIAAALAAWLQFSGAWVPLAELGVARGNYLERLLAVNVMLVLFNLLPAFPMDGGRVLRALLAMRMEHARATRIAAGVGKGMAVLFGFAGLFSNPMLLFIALFVWVGASEEAAAVQMKSSFAGVPVRAAMLTEFHAVTPSNTLGQVARLLLAGSQQDFPVIEGGRVVGLLARRDLIQALQRRGEEVPVGEIMRREFGTVSAAEPLEAAIARHAGGPELLLPVLEHGELVGLLTTENVGEYLLVRTALDRRRPA